MWIMYSAPGLLLRAAEAPDVPLVTRWLSDPRVLAFYGGRDKTINENVVRQRYFSRRRDPITGRFYEHRACLVEVEGTPTAFVQYYRLGVSDAEFFGYPRNDRSYGFDLFIGSPEMWGRGLGPRLIELTRDYLRRKRGAVRVVVDPQVDNTRSVRAFEKAGFRRTRRLLAREIHEGVPRDCWLLEYP